MSLQEESRGRGRNIIICCDGTDNGVDGAFSNVPRLCVALTANDEQLVYYRTGIGTEESAAVRTRAGVAVSKLLGRIAGAGIATYVADAYRFLSEVYCAGDRIYVFGFSRGGYTASVLIRMIEHMGLLMPGCSSMAPYMTRTYARILRSRKGLKLSTARQLGFTRLCEIHFVGLWDPVDSVGLFRDSFRLTEGGFSCAAHIVRVARAIDERRSFFAPMPLFARNHGIYQDFQSVWFAGNHCDIGGSYDDNEIGLSQITYRWMLEAAREAGVTVSMAKMRALLGEAPLQGDREEVFERSMGPNIHQPPHDELKSKPFWWLGEVVPRKVYSYDSDKYRIRIPMGKRRTMPGQALVHSSVFEKVRSDDHYKPSNLVPGDTCRTD